MKTKAAANDRADAPPSAEDIAKWLAVLHPADHAIEIRAPGYSILGASNPVNVVKRFAPGASAKAAAEARRLSGDAPAVYFVMNGVDPSLPTTPTTSRLKGASAKDVPGRRRLLIDCDPVRPADVSSTDDEKAEALKVADKVRAFLAARGAPQPVTADSGNGWHLVYAIDLPNEADSTALVKAVLAALARRFDTGTAKVDCKVFDAPRLVKLYGTLAAKGENTPDRPHRYARVLTAPAELDTMPTELLRELAAEATPEPAGFDLADEIERKRGQEPAGGDATRGMTFTATASNGRRPDAETRAIAYLATCDPAISGKSGHNKAFKACRVGPGFDLAEDVAFRLLWNHYNPRCDPPWTEKELRHKVEDAYKSPKNSPRGFLLNVERNGTTKGHGRGGAGTTPPEANGSSPKPQRPDILITTEEHEVIDQAVAAMAADPTVFQRAFMLTTVQRDNSPAQGIIRPPGSPRMCPLPMPRLRERLTKFAKWVKRRPLRDGGFETVGAHPPDWAISAVAARGEWPLIRPLEAVTESPVLRHAGTVLDVPGYDPTTGLLYEPNAEFPPIKASPTLGDAKDAAAELLDLVVDFPFANAAHQVAWLSALLTPLARFAIAGPCPLFLIDATTAGSGKGLLADVIAFVCLGREMSRKDYPDENDEMRKTITSIALAGDRLVLFDNVSAPLGGSALDAALTGRTWKDRILGRSEMSPDLPLFTVWFATGNNVMLRGDMMRRIIPCRLEPKVERPEERTDFKYPKLMDHVRRNRPRLVAKALTILRAYFVAGRPDQKLIPLGSYDEWADVVRSAVFWTTGIDPCEARDDLRAADDTANNVAGIIEGWSELPNGDRGLTAADAIKLVKAEPEKLATLHEALMAWSRNDDLPTQRIVGNRLKALLGKVVGGKQMHSEPGRARIQLWSVRTVKPRPSGESGESGESSSDPSRENCADKCNSRIWDMEVKKTHQTHQTHQNGDDPSPFVVTASGPTHRPDGFSARVKELMDDEFLTFDEANRRASDEFFGGGSP